ncbi:MAG TPA: DUF1634 domain-containing protein [Candidatus Limnocylindrales bacterium]
MTADRSADTRSPTSGDLDRTVARLLTLGTYASVALLGVGVVAMIAAGQSPLDSAFPTLDLGRLPSELGGLRPTGFLWLGLLVVVATPASRVLASLVGYLRRGDRAMAGIAFAILAVIAVTVLVAGVTGA